MGASGVTYVRWGTSKCPTGVQTVYTGIMSGSNYNQIGGGANVLCAYDQSKFSYHHSQQLNGNGGLFQTAAYWYGSSKILGKPVPCATCYSKARSAKLMIPGIVNCPAGWKLEYDGYITTGHSSYKNNIAFECMDKNAVGHGARTNAPWPHGYIYTVRIATNPKAVTCVVCTR